ncbi:MAG: hypothetical protein M5U27_05565 [Gaiella sp.]|nr:hypothetical protein [Gaiella sp.]
MQYTLIPRADFPLRTGHNVQFVVRAYRAVIPRSAASTAAASCRCPRGRPEQPGAGIRIAGPAPGKGYW